MATSSTSTSCCSRSTGSEDGTTSAWATNVTAPGAMSSGSRRKTASGIFSAVGELPLLAFHHFKRLHGLSVARSRLLRMLCAGGGEFCFLVVESAPDEVFPSRAGSRSTLFLALEGHLACQRARRGRNGPVPASSMPLQPVVAPMPEAPPPLRSRRCSTGTEGNLGSFVLLHADKPASEDFFLASSGICRVRPCGR